MKKRKIIRMAEKKEQENHINCPFCTDHRKIPVDPDWIEQHLIVILDKSFHWHVHGPIGDKELMKRFIFKIAKEANIDIEDEGGEQKDEPEVIESRRLERKIKNKEGSRGTKSQVIKGKSRATKKSTKLQPRKNKIIKTDEDSTCQGEEKDSTYQDGIIPDETA